MYVHVLYVMNVQWYDYVASIISVSQGLMHTHLHTKTVHDYITHDAYTNIISITNTYIRIMDCVMILNKQNKYHVAIVPGCRYVLCAMTLQCASY